MISIIIPVSQNYADKYLRECLDSIIPQLGENEIIIPGFDISREDGTELCNEVIAKSRGEWILIVGADDTLEPGCIHKLEEQKDNCDVYYGNMQIFGDFEQFVEYPKEITAINQIERNDVPWTSLFRKSYFEKVGGFFAGPERVNDWDFWMKLILEGAKFKHIGSTIMHHRRHSGQVSETLKDKMDYYRENMRKEYQWRLL